MAVLFDRGTLYVCAFFVVVAAFLGWNADSSLGFGPDQISYNIAADELLDAWENGLPLSNELGPVHRQSFALAHTAGRRLVGDAATSYQLILALSAFAYLVAMYILLVNVLQDRTIAAVTTVLSIVQRYTIGTSYWGMGEFQSILPRIVVLAVFPLAWLLFERHLRTRRVLWAFLFVSLGIALHLSAIFFYCILLLTLGLYVLGSRSWPLLLNVVLAAAFLLFAFRSIPSPISSNRWESVPFLVFLSTLVGFGLVLYFSKSTRRPWVGGVAVVYLGLCFFWLMGGSSFQAALGLGVGEREVPMSGSPNPATRPADPTGPPGEVAGGPSETTSRPPLEVSPPVEASRRPPAETSALPVEASRLPVEAPRRAAETPRPPVESARPPIETPRPPGEVADSSGETPADDLEIGAGTPDQAPSERDRLAALNRAIYARFGWTLFPISLATLGFALFNGGILAAVALYEFGYRWRRGATEREHIVGLYFVSVIVVSLGITGAVQLYCRLTGRPDMVLELFRALRFAFLPLYIYLGLFLRRTWRQAMARKDGRRLLLLAALVVVLLMPPRQVLAALPDRVKLFARGVAESSLHQGDPSQGKYLRTLLATDAEKEKARAQNRDFIELCEWVKDSTPAESVFMTTRYDFIHYTDRDIMISYAQGAGSARSVATVSGYVGWYEAYLEISGALASNSPDRILSAARRYEVDYVLTEADRPPLPAEPVYSNASYTLFKLSD